MYSNISISLYPLLLVFNLQTAKSDDPRQSSSPFVNQWHISSTGMATCYCCDDKSHQQPLKKLSLVRKFTISEIQVVNIAQSPETQPSVALHTLVFFLITILYVQFWHRFLSSSLFNFCQWQSHLANFSVLYQY